MQQIFDVIFIIAGAFTCLGIITAIIGIPQIIAGVKIFKSVSAFSWAANLHKEEYIVAAIENLHGDWKYFLIVFVILYIAIIISIFASYSGNGYQ